MRKACIKPQLKNPQSISFSTKKYSVDFFPPPTFSLVGMLSWSKSVCAFPLVYRLISSHLHLFKFTSSREVNLSILINIGKNDFFFSHPNLKLINFFFCFYRKRMRVQYYNHANQSHNFEARAHFFELFILSFFVLFWFHFVRYLFWLFFSRQLLIPTQKRFSYKKVKIS